VETAPSLDVAHCLSPPSHLRPTRLRRRPSWLIVPHLEHHRANNAPARLASYHCVASRTLRSSDGFPFGSTNWSRFPLSRSRYQIIMDDHRFRQPGLPMPNGAQYQPLAPQSYGGSQNSHAPTLPPLQGNSHFPSPLYGQSNSTPQTPITPQTPASGAASNTSSSVPPIHPPLRPLQPNPQFSSLPVSSYPTSQPPLLQTSTAHSNAQHLGPAPLSSGLQDLRAGGLGMPLHHSQMYSHPPILQNSEPEPVHVVGQQGRRGVLPTHPGRPAPTAGKPPTNPNKNADGKFECPHCNKTYLHLKHLKRHLLRRTY
jgi:hypothetical protein